MSRITQVEQLISQMDGIMICMNETLKLRSTYKPTDSAYHALKIAYIKMDSVYSELYNIAQDLLSEKELCLK